MRLSIVAVVAAAIAAVPAAAWSFKDGSIAVVERAGTLSTAEFSAASAAGVIRVPTGATARVKFDVVGGVPHQAFVLVSDAVSGLQTVVVADVRGNGRARADIDAKTVPAPLLTGRPLNVELVLASFGADAPLRVPVGSVVLPAVDSPAPVRYAAQPEIHHTFRPAPRTAPRSITLLFCAAVGAALLGLFVSWAALGLAPNNLAAAAKASPFGHLGFLSALVLLESAFFRFYVGDSVFKLLGSTCVLAPILFVCGSRALREVRTRRLAGLW
ncbi:uncharacterized protein V1510DRAFT_445237 [Dipodascopsis tothii]|uniref:uncharacterized protein n=1 Tax=Dipodascopsis tothii TaxID=44089 RepID=UPI0034CE1D86